MRLAACMVAVALLLLGSGVAQAAGPTVLAAASLQEALEDVSRAWVQQGHERPVLSFAASSALARQIDAGAPADLFISADEDWMNDVAGKGMIVPGSRATLLTNRLVLVAPAGTRNQLPIAPGFPIARALGKGRLAIADPASVPAGRYAKAALTSLRVWPSVKDRIAVGENVRAALTLVERKEAPLGIVYATDAKASALVRVLGVFPATSHPPILYPVARLKAGKSRDAEAFRSFLISAKAKTIFRRRGFGTR